MVACDTVNRAVASDTRGPEFESSPQQFYKEKFYTVGDIEKTKIDK